MTTRDLHPAISVPQWHQILAEEMRYFRLELTRAGLCCVCSFLLLWCGTSPALPPAANNAFTFQVSPQFFICAVFPLSFLYHLTLLLFSSDCSLLLGTEDSARKESCKSQQCATYRNGGNNSGKKKKTKPPVLSANSRSTQEVDS